MPTYQTLYRKIKVGMTVRLREQLETRGGVLLAKGLHMRVTNKRGGLHLETMNDKPCKTCGIGEKKTVRGVSPFDVEVLSEKGDRKK